MSLLMPETKVPVRPSLADLAPSGLTAEEEAVNLRSRILYLRSYLLMRTIIGFMGLTLPIVLIAGDVFLRDEFTVRGSLSGYYYAGTRDVFVGSMTAIALFLITYKLFERSLNNLLSVVAGIAALVVAFAPTRRPDGMDVVLTPLQERFGELSVSHVHYGAAGVFIVSLAIISFFFGVQEGRRSPQRVGRQSMLPPGFWRWFHWVNAAAILLAVGFVVFTGREHMTTNYSLLIGEAIAIVAFGLSWLTKGLELDVLLGPSRRQLRQAAAETP